MQVSDLELSVRTANVLSAEGITEIRQFLLLSEADVMSMKHAGRKTWNEVRDVQAMLEQDQAARTFAQLCQLVSQWNYLLSVLNEDPRKASKFMFTMDKTGRIAAWECASG